MATRTNDKSNSQLGRLRNRIRSALFASEGDGATDAESQSDDAAATNPTAPGNLFHCSTCGTVYIDVEKRNCSECEESVTEVRSTLESASVR